MKISFLLIFLSLCFACNAFCCEASLEEKKALHFFDNISSTVQKELITALKKSKSSATLKKIKNKFSIVHNFDNPNDFIAIKKLILKIAPSLNPDAIGFLKVRPNAQNTDNLIVYYINLEFHAECQYSDPYLYVWVFINQNTQMKVSFLGKYLDGNILNLYKLNNQKTQSLFIEYYSCTGCDAPKLAHVITFDNSTFIPTHLKFADCDEKNKWFDFFDIEPRPETIDTCIDYVETRIVSRLENDQNFASIIRHFKSKQSCDYPSEWIVSDCFEKDGCACEIFSKDLPKEYLKSWKSGISLGKRKGSSH
jgi:hypothetical protein